MNFTEPITLPKFGAKADELRLLIRPLLAELDTLPMKYATKVDRYTYGSYSTLHRGVYCPSLVDDIFSNQRRGREVKAPRKTPMRFRYGFSNGELIQVETIYNGKISGIEYLMKTEGVRVGATFGTKHNLVAIAQEKFDQGVLKEYHMMYFNGAEGQPSEYFCEHYAYDNQGLFACNYQEFRPIPRDAPIRIPGFDADYVLRNMCFHFERCEGMLKSYTATIFQEGQSPKMDNNGKPYPVLVKRKA